jgi:hypothetical protein
MDVTPIQMWPHDEHTSTTGFGGGLPIGWGFPSWALFEHTLIASITDVISKSKLKKRCAVDKTQRHRKVRQDNKGHTTSLPNLV